MSDLHVPFHEPRAVQAAIAYGRKFKPDTVLLNGDIADFYQVSRWDKNPSRCNGMKAEIGVVEEALSFVRGCFPKARFVYKMGNHEERWDKFIWAKAAEIWDVAACRVWDVLHLEDKGIEWVGDQRPITAGHLPIFHGHELGRSLFSPVNPARGAFLRAHHTIMVAHSHQTSGHADTNIWHDETFCWSIGCLCTLTPEYARVNRWNHGLACVTVSNDGSFDVENLRISKDFEVRKS
jgi:hypothetical protein